MSEDVKSGARQEKRDSRQFTKALAAFVQASIPMAHYGDGNCGFVFYELKKALETAGAYRSPRGTEKGANRA